MTLRLDLMQAATLARDSYNGPDALPLLKRMTAPGTPAEAYLTQGGILVIPGTNGADDWLRYNLQAAHARGSSLGWAERNAFVAASLWHYGFLRHATEVLSFLGPETPKAIIGHSLGAATAQILGMHFGVPTVTFAAPRPLIGALPLPNEGWVLNIVHTDDIIGVALSATAGFRRIGSVRMLTQNAIPGLTHSMDDYIPALRARLADGSLQPEWPPMLTS
jgi:hypothetical protein